MFLSDLPKPIKAFLDATEARDSRALLATLASDAVLTDMGEEHRGDAIRKWNDTLYLGANVSVHPIHVEERDGAIVLAVCVDGDYESFGVSEPFQLDWHIKLSGDLIASIRMVEVKLDVPKPVLRFIQAMNTYDSEALVNTFEATALANDQRRQYVGREAIDQWLRKEITGDQVTMYVTEVVRPAGGCAVLARVTGNYDKTGLPDPLELRFYFTLSEEAIGQLVVIPKK